MAKGRSASTLFLTELICAVLVFVGCCAICVSLFAGADKISRESYELNNAVFAAEGAAEIYYNGSDIETLLSAESDPAGKIHTVYYGSDWQTGSGTDYCMTIEEKEEKAVIKVFFTETEREIFTLTVQRPAGRSAD